jgi:hypothetical protein
MVSYADFRNPRRPEPEQAGRPWGCQLPVIDADKAEAYRTLLAARAKQLLSIRFGAFWEEKPGEKVPSGYDKDYFIKGLAEDGEDLELISGKLPSEAMQAILDHPEKWRLDCSAFTQIVLGLAYLDRIKPKNFNKKFSRETLFFSQRSNACTHLTAYYERKNPEYKPIMFLPDRTPCPADQDREDEELFQLCPVGTVFVFRNGDVPDLGKADYRFEHTIRLGPDSFIAHALVKGKNILTLKELREGLASITHKAYGKPNESLENYALRIVWMTTARLLNTHLIEKK